MTWFSRIIADWKEETITNNLMRVITMGGFLMWLFGIMPGFAFKENLFMVLSGVFLLISIISIFINHSLSTERNNFKNSVVTERANSDRSIRAVYDNTKKTQEILAQQLDVSQKETDKWMRDYNLLVLQYQDLQSRVYGTQDRDQQFHEPAVKFANAVDGGSYTIYGTYGDVEKIEEARKKIYRP